MKNEKLGMKKCKILLVVCLFFAGKIQAEISTLTPLSFEVDSNSQLLVLNSSLKEKDPIIAWLISFPGGMLGLHRAYLGTSTQTIILYIITAGGVFGIVPTLDWILLLKGIQNGDISKFINNRRFIMWL
jgi:TM2 domain-containing membrane protein YozV